MKDFFKKILDAIKTYFKGKEAQINELIKKVKPMIDDLMKHIKVDLIGKLKGFAIELLGDLIKLIIGWGDSVMVLNDEVDMKSNDMKDFFKKILDAIKTYFKGKEAQINELIKKVKPMIDDLMKHIKVDLIGKLKGFAIELLGDLIKLIIGWGDNGIFNDEGVTVVNGDIQDFFKKVKEFFVHVGEVIKGFFESVFSKEARQKIIDVFTKFGMKAAAYFEKLFEKYKDVIIATLKRDGKVILEEVKRLVLTFFKTTMNAIIDIVKKIIGEDMVVQGILNDEETAVGNPIDDFFKQLFEKIKKIVVAYFDGRIAEFDKFGKKYKPVFINEGKKFKTDLIKYGKTLLIDMLNDIIKIIIDPPEIVGDMLTLMLDEEVVNDDCIEPRPEYCIKNEFLCKEPAFIDFMKSMCPRTCGYCN